MENYRLAKRADNIRGDLDNIIDELIREIEELEVRVVKLSDENGSLQKEIDELKNQ